MARTDDDSWDITEGIGASARRPTATTEDATPRTTFIEGVRG
jgi:hypothetical protein